MKKLSILAAAAGLLMASSALANPPPPPGHGHFKPPPHVVLHPVIHPIGPFHPVGPFHPAPHFGGHGPHFGGGPGPHGFGPGHGFGHSPHMFHWGFYHRPHGWYYRQWGYGEYLPSIFWVQDYWIPNYVDFGLEPPPYGFTWVRYGDDALLIDQSNGQVVEAEYGIFD